MSRVFNLECKNCGKLFKANSSNVKYCNNCYEDRKCSNEECDNIVNHIFVGDVNNHFCSKECRYKTINKNKTKPGYCTKCGSWSDKRDSTGRCRSCVSKQVENSWNGCTIENKINRLKGIKSVPNFLYGSPNCLKHKECNLQYFDKISNKYIC